MHKINTEDERWRKVESKESNSETLVGHFKDQSQGKERKDDMNRHLEDRKENGVRHMDYGI